MLTYLKNNSIINFLSKICLDSFTSTFSALFDGILTNYSERIINSPLH